jgi:hypothetical protein
MYYGVPPLPKKRARLLWLPSTEQRRLKDGRLQPHRLFTEDGREIVGVITISAYGGDEGRPTSLSIELHNPKVTKITKRPARKP